MKQAKKAELFKEFLQNNEILVIDKSSASRRRLTKTLVDMGSKRNQVHSVSHYSEAIEVIKTNKPKLVLSDYAVNGGSGFDLFKEFRETYPEEKKATLVLITSNISQSAVAKAAEEDVDSFIIKPYTVKSLEKSLINAVINKLYPSEYVQTIEKGKEKMFAGEYQEALSIFEEALSLNKKPALAHFYHGQAKYFLESIDEAEDDYGKGLALNNLHFKCQIGLYEIFQKEKRYKEAYDVVRNIAKYFPANPDRLKEVVRLCMITKNYEDMDMYYDIFVNLEERTDDVIDYICAGLYIYGKFSMMNNDKSKGKEIFEKVGVSCAGKAKFLKAMIINLVENEIYLDAQKLVNRFASSDENVADYEISSYIAHSGNASPTDLVSQGLELFNKGFKHPMSTRIMIEAMRKAGSDKKAEEYLDEAQHLWPEEFGGNKKAA